MAQKCPKADICHTSHLKTVKTSILWTIDSFSLRPEKTGQKLLSPTFSANKDTNKWHLEIYPNAKKEENKEFVSLYLYESDMNEVSAEYKFALIDRNQCLHKEKGPNNCHFKPSGLGWGFSRFFKRSRLVESKELLLPNDRLNIYCEVICSKLETISGPSTDLKLQFKTLADDMTALFENQNNCDVDILVKGHKFTAHKFILMARSPVFAAMFEHRMKEKLQNQVIIEDIDKKAFNRLLRFIYTDKIESEDIDSNIKLLSAANKYNLEALKSICEEYIGSQLSVETVCEVLILADNLLAENLKIKAIDFIKCNLTEVVKTEGWINDQKTRSVEPDLSIVKCLKMTQKLVNF